ncbi:MAG: sulfotransferase family 2 domain-containing protein [Paracoccaceae bacterium]
MLISHSHRFVFVHIPKTAGTSLAQVLTPYCQEAPGTRARRIARKLGLRQDPARAFFRSHDTAAHVLRAFGPERFAGYRVFSVIRNPFDHAVSHYTYLREFPKPRVARAFSAMSFGDYLDFSLRPRRCLAMPPFATIGDQTGFLDDGVGPPHRARPLAFRDPVAGRGGAGSAPRPAGARPAPCTADQGALGRAEGSSMTPRSRRSCAASMPAISPISAIRPTGATGLRRRVRL